MVYYPKQGHQRNTDEMKISTFPKYQIRLCETILTGIHFHNYIAQHNNSLCKTLILLVI